jgi:hypothetical protein
MSNKKRLITLVVLALATIMIVISVAIVAGIFFLRGSTDTVAMSGTTAVGVPNGPATTKSIGPAGGSIASPDGKITVEVPPNAVSGPVDFSIQPITNLAHGGVGSAYRLEPSGQKFAPPIEVSFKFDAQDLKGYDPETLAIAYQDPAGVWQSFRTVNINQASKKLIVSTTHFTDLSVWTIRLSPEKATIHVGETQLIAVEGCIEKDDWGSRLKTLLGMPTCHFFMPQDNSWSVNVGTIAMVPGAVLYTAPAKKPSPNVATVRLVYKLRGSLQKDGRTCEITIVDGGYTASGESHDETYSGVICDLAKEFTVNGSGLANFAFKFVPSSNTANGTVSYSSSYAPGGAPAIESGSGSYTVKGIDTDNPRIVLTIDKATASVMGHAVQPSKAGTVVINLTPSGPDECNKK